MSLCKIITRTNEVKYTLVSVCQAICLPVTDLYNILLAECLDCDYVILLNAAIRSPQVGVR